MRPATRLHRMPAATRNEFRARDAPPTPARAAVSVNVVVGGGERAAGALHQVGLDELIDVAVEHTVDVADLFLRPVILHELIGMEYVAANLTAERDLLFRAADLFERRLLFF